MHARMFEFLLAPLILLLLPMLVHQPVALAVCALLLMPGAYAMITGAPYVPTPQKTLEKMLRLAAIRPGERVYDLGCGDGRLIFAAVRAGARATGFELSMLVFFTAKIRSWFRGGQILYRDFWRQDLSDADVVFCYLLPGSMRTFQRRLWPKLKPGTRVVSHAFVMDGIEPDAQEGAVRLYVKM